MKHTHYITALLLYLLLASCSGTDNKTELENIDPSAKVIRDEGWRIIPKMENGDRVYWFLAPEVDNVSPAMFKKIVYTGARSELKTKIVSQCDAPKQTCDNLMKKFDTLSEKYK